MKRLHQTLIFFVIVTFTFQPVQALARRRSSTWHWPLHVERIALAIALAMAVNQIDARKWPSSFPAKYHVEPNSCKSAGTSSPLFISRAFEIGSMSSEIPLKRRLLTFRGGSTGFAISKVAKHFLDDVASSKAKSWAALFAAILLETFASTLSKRARDTSSPSLFLVSVALNLVSLCGFCACLAKLDVGVAYAIWAALGTVIVTAAGIFFFGEAASPIKLLSIALVILGVVGLNLTEGH